MQIISLAAMLIADAGVIVGALVTLHKFKKETHERLEKVMEGMKCQHRSEMLRTYYHNAEEKKIRQYEFENFLMHYNSYKILGGNSFIDKIHKEVSEWDIVT